jgi:hypothetical protein
MVSVNEIFRRTSMEEVVFCFMLGYEQFSDESLQVTWPG